jgi:hypothetical protein
MRRDFYKRLIKTSKELETDYLEDIRTKPSDFTRSRKTTIEDLFLQMVANKGKSQKNEIYSFYKDIRKDMDISQTAFYNARMKFNPEALVKIMKDLTSEEYRQPEMLVTLNDYFVMAIDGSEFVLPYTEEMIEKYGTCASPNKYGEAQSMASVSTYFDCINKLFLDIKINKYKYSERLAASEHMIEVDNLLPDDAKYLTIFDRGYGSIKLIDQMLNKNQKFLFRLSGNMFKKEQKELLEDQDDRWIEIKYDRLRSNDYRDDKKFRIKLMNTIYRLRFIRLVFEKENGEITYNTFLTNLAEDEFVTEDFYELYHLRWDIETSYRSLKSQFKVEDFSGYRDQLVRQDIYAATLVHNAVSMTIAENEAVRNVPEDRYKYEMKTNRNFALGVLKKDILELFILYKQKKAASKAQASFEKNIVKYSCPIRRERIRKYERISKGLSKCKYGYRRSF